MNVKRLRKKLGLTIEELAVKVGVTSATIYRWENNNIKPHRTFLKTMEALLKESNGKQKI